MSQPFITALPGIGGISRVGPGNNIPDIPDVPAGPTSAGPMQTGAASATGVVDFTGLVSSIQNVSGALVKANKAESDFASGHGNLLEMMLQRKIADTYLSVAEAESSKATQAISTLMNMQV